MKQARFIVTIDMDFPAVIAECAAPRPDREDTWINSDIKRLYIALHKLGFAHSIEVWDGDRLVGAFMEWPCALRFLVSQCSHVLQTHQRSRWYILSRG